MNFKTHNEIEVSTGGTSFQGNLNGITFQQIKKVFGKPTGSDGYKSDAEWEILFEDGTVATIYNWKNGKNYQGRDGIAKTKITEWHIGGRDQKSVKIIKQIFA